MKAVIQRVTKAQLKVDGETVSEIGRGYVVFFGVRKGDTEKEAEFIVGKLVRLRIFEDENGKINRYIDFNVYDNHYLQGYIVYTYDSIDAEGNLVGQKPPGRHAR